MTWLDAAMNLAREFEGCSLGAYPDPVYGWRKATIGYGCTGPGIVQGTVWTQQQADNDLMYRMKGVGAHIDSLVKVPLTDEQKGALCDLAYNIGLGAFAGSTLLRMLNGHNPQGAADQFLVWDAPNDPAVTAGLLRRRQAERALFLSASPQPGESQPQPECAT